MSSVRVVTGIDLPFAPSCGSMILCSDVYGALRARLSTTFLALPATGPRWEHGFDAVVECHVDKAPYGPHFDVYMEKLTSVVGEHLAVVQPDVIHAQHLGFGLSLAFCRAGADVPIIAVAHGTDVIAAQGSPQALDALTEVVTAAESVILPTWSLRDQLDAVTSGRWVDKLHVVPWGIPLRNVADPHRPGVRRALNLLHAGRLDANKSTVTAIEALALTSERHTLHVVGSGDQLPMLRQRAADLGVADRVSFMPFVGRGALWSMFAHYDAFLLTTGGLEAFGLVGIEAQAHGVPVIYSKVAGLLETIGGSGLGYAPGDAQHLANAVDIVAGDVNARVRISQEGLRNSRLFDVQRTARKIESLSAQAARR